MLVLFYSLTFHDGKENSGQTGDEIAEHVIDVEPYVFQKRGPYPRNVPNL